MHPSQLYFIALIPPQPLREDVKALKTEMKSRFGAAHALKSPAHITLQMPFKREETEEAQLLSGLKEFAAGQRPFQIELSGFDCFAPRVIYIKIVEHQIIQSLHDRLQYFLLKKMHFLPKEVSARFHPHMTIATRDLKKQRFAEAWPEFAGREFSAGFEVRSLFLLKHNGRFWEIYREFNFEDALV